MTLRKATGHIVEVLSEAATSDGDYRQLLEQHRSGEHRDHPKISILMIANITKKPNKNIKHQKNKQEIIKANFMKHELFNFAHH